MSEHLDSDFTEHSESKEQPAFKERASTGPHNPRINPPEKRCDPVFYIGIVIAAICILGIFSVTSFIAGFTAANMLNKNGIGKFVGPKDRMPEKPGYGDGPEKNEIVAKVEILKSANSFQFSQQIIKMPPYKGIAWFNSTDQTQIITADNGKLWLKIAPGEVNTTFIKEESTVYVLHLNNDSNASVTIYVDGSR